MEQYDVTIKLRMVQAGPLRAEGGKYGGQPPSDMQQVAELAAAQTLIAMAGGTHNLAGKVQAVVVDPVDWGGA